MLQIPHEEGDAKLLEVLPHVGVRIGVDTQQCEGHAEVDDRAKAV